MQTLSESHMSHIARSSYFAGILLNSQVKNLKILLLGMGLPLFMLASFWLPALSGDPESIELLEFMFSAILSLCVMTPGLMQASRVSKWLSSGIIARLSLCPVPLVYLLLADGASWVAFGLAQAIIMLVLGVLLRIASFSLTHIIVVFCYMAIGSILFITMGLVIGTLTKAVDKAGYIFLFLFVPLFFLGSFPPEMLPESVNKITPYLPTSLVIQLIHTTTLEGRFHEKTFLYLVSILVYLLVFLFIIGFSLKKRIQK